MPKSKLKNNILKVAITLLSLCCLIQCSSSLETIAPENKSAVWQQNKKQLQNLKAQNTWSLLARVGIVTKQGSSSSQLDWFNNNTNYAITIKNAITFGEIKINKQQNNISLNYQDKTYQANSPNELLFRLTELKLPVSELEYWILGLPSPNMAIDKLELNEHAVVQELKQNHYKITYDDYMLENSYILPNKIIIKAPGLHIKIIIESWFV